MFLFTEYSGTQLFCEMSQGYTGSLLPLPGSAEVLQSVPPSQISAMISCQLCLLHGCSPKPEAQLPGNSDINAIKKTKQKKQHISGSSLQSEKAV